MLRVKRVLVVPGLGSTGRTCLEVYHASLGPNVHFAGLGSVTWRGCRHRIVDLLLVVRSYTFLRH
jgi:hypothetical protein